MKTIIYNRFGSTLTPNLESFATRIGYLLGDITINAGSTESVIFTEYNVADLSVKQKIEILERCLENEADREALETSKRVLKEHNKTKHKSPQQIVAYKKLEHSLAALCNHAINEYWNAVSKTGLLELRNLVDDKAFAFYGINENAEDNSDCHVPASELLQLLNPEEEGPEMFFLPQEFFRDEFWEDLPYTISETEAEAEDLNKVYYDCCFTFPNLNLLSAAQLKLVRKQLSDAGAQYRANADEWMRRCYNSEDVSSRINYFNVHVLPAAQTLQQAIQQNEILQHCSRLQYDSVKFDVLMGEIPVYMLWDFYKSVEVITEPTWEKLSLVKEEGSLKNKRWPFMVLGILKDEKNEQTLPGIENQIASVKKSILID
jgi:hypothetical protein